jgi:Ca2+-binding RTX toxin-like protein
MALITGTSGNDMLAGTSGDDTINAGAGNDDIAGNGGNDTINGEDGDDFIAVDKGAHHIDGGAGTDTLRLLTPLGADESDLYTVDLRNNFFYIDPFGPASSVTGIENVTGSAVSDLVWGTAAANILAGEDGSDNLFGGAGDDLLLASGNIRMSAGQLVITEIGADLAGDGLYGDAGNDRLVGGLGGDFLSGGFDNDTLEGNAGDDQLYGGRDQDTLSGGLGNDLLAGGTGNDIVDGADGIDTAYFYNADPAFGGVTVSLQLQGSAQNVGSQGLDTLTGIENLLGTAFSDSLTGDDGANVLAGAGPAELDGSPSTNNDTLAGLGGNDLLLVVAGDHGLDGGADTDTVSYHASLPEPGAVYTSLTLSLALQGSAQATGYGNWTLSNIENLSGANGDDQLTGDGGANVLAGSAGSDTLTGGAGNDVLLGDGEISWGYGTPGAAVTLENVPYIPLGGFFLIVGNDILDGGTGDDRMVGGRHDDIYYVDSLGDVVVEEAGQGTDEVRTGLTAYSLAANVETLTGIGFGQALTGNASANTISGTSGNDVIDGGAEADAMSGGGGGDIYYVDNGGDTVTEAAGSGIDEIRTSLASFSLAALANVENLTGIGSAGQTLTGNDAANVIDGGVGDDSLSGGEGDDILVGGTGSDTLTGGGGSDRLFSHVETAGFGYPYTGASLDTFAETDMLSGGAGDDFLLAGYGDSVDGGAGWDSLYISFQGASAGVEADFRAMESLGSATIAGGTFTGIETVWYLEGSEFDDFLAPVGGGPYVPVYGTVYGRGGNDHIVTTYYSGPVFGGDGNDLIDNSAGVYGYALNGDSGDDTIVGGTGYDHIYGGDGNDLLQGNEGFDTIYGGIGNDIIEGGGLADTLYGEVGNDSLDGGTGADAMAGGAGNDIYYVDEAGDTVTESAGEGTDEVRTSLGSKAAPDYALYVLPNYVENLTGTSAGPQGVRGNSLDNVIVMASGADLIVLDDGGVDNINAGGGNDYIYYGATLTAADITNGGAGTDTVGLLGNYAGLVFTATNLVGVERLALYTGGGVNSYNVTMNDANVAAGTEFFVTAASLNASEILTFNGAAETNGRFTLLGGGGADTIVGGAGGDYVAGNGGNDTLYGLGGSDTLFGGAGADQLRGGAGQDFFRYQATTDSMTGSVDQILDFTGIDRIDLSAIDAIGGGANDAFTFIGASAFHNVAGELRAYQSGPSWFVEGDVNGDGVADVLIQVSVADANPLGAANFIL